MSRSLLLTLLLAGYAVTFVGTPRPASRSPFDPLEPRGRQVEQAIEVGRFSDALPVALDLQQRYPDEAVITYWMAEIYRGLGRSVEEAAAWERFSRQTGLPADARQASER